MSRNLSKWLIAFALVAAPAIPAMAQGQQQDQQQQGQQQQQAGQQQQQGFQSPEEAAQTFFSALQNKDVNQLRQTVPPEERQEFDRYGDTLIESVEVTDYQIQSVEMAETQDRAHATYTWNVDVDEDKMLEAYRNMIRESLQQEGMTDQEIEEILSQQEQSLRQELNQQVQQLEQQQNRMTLEKVDDSWYVTSPAENIEMKEPHGQQEQQPQQQQQQQPQEQQPQQQQQQQPQEQQQQSEWERELERYGEQESQQEQQQGGGY